MSVFKALDSSDVFTTDYVARKVWSVSGSDLKSLGVRCIKAYSGSLPYVPKPEDLEPYYPGESLESGSYYPRLMYESIRHLYYSGSLSGIPVEMPSTGSIEENYIEHFDGAFTGSRDLSLQSTITVPDARKLPTGSYGHLQTDTEIVAYTIPNEFYGFNIEEGSFKLNLKGDLLYYVDKGYVSASYIEEEDLGTLRDKDGVLLYTGYDELEQKEVKDKVVGDIIYNQGTIILTDPLQVDIFSKYICNSIGWRSNTPIYTQNVKCHIEDSEFNYTYNSSFEKAKEQYREIKKQREDLHLPDTCPYTPYISSVGLYNGAGELLAIAKLSKPIKKLDSINTTINVRIDLT